MSEPKAATDAQHLDLGALGDALGAIDDAVKEDGPTDKAAPANESSETKHESRETPQSPSKSARKPNNSSKSGNQDGAPSPDTLSPNSLRSQSPVSSSPPVASSDARDANSLSQTNSEDQKTPPAATQMSREMQDKVKAVKGMFPTIEVDTIAAVLAAEDGNEENGESSQKRRVKRWTTVDLSAFAFQPSTCCCPWATTALRHPHGSDQISARKAIFPQMKPWRAV